jgi:hypothetical protein
VSSAFRLLHRSDVGCHSQGPRFSSGSALGPSHDGIRRMRRTNLQRRPCRKTYGRHKDSKRTRLIHRPCGDIAPPVGGIHIFSCRILLFTTRCEIHERHKCALRHGRSCLLGRAERSSPKAAQRRAAGAGLDGERAHRAIIRAAEMRTTIGHSRVMWPQLLPWSSETRSHPPTCDA